jgi:hypothetical protein
MTLSVDLGSNPITTAVWSTPTSESRPGIVKEYNLASWIVTATYPFPLGWISKEHDSVLGDRRQRCAYRRTMPMDRSAGKIEFPYQPGFAGHPIEHAYVSGGRNRTFNDGNEDSPYRSPQNLGAVQIFGLYPYARKMERAE